MGIFDAFTGAAAKKASGANMAYLNRGMDLGSEMLGWGGDNSRRLLQDEAIPALEKGYGGALTALQEYYPISQGFAGEATAAYDPMIASGKAGTDAYSTAMGLGPGGMEAATAAFRNTPGYSFMRDEATDAALRSASAQGLLASGNTTADVLNRVTGLADTTYGSYLQRLQPLMSMYNTGVAGRASGLTNQANLASGMGTNTANLHSSMGRDIANVYGNVANTYTDQARSLANLYSQGNAQLGQAAAGGIMGAANAQRGLLNNGLDLVGSLLTTPASTVGASVGGNLFKSLWG